MINKKNFFNRYILDVENYLENSGMRKNEFFLIFFNQWFQPQTVIEKIKYTGMYFKMNVKLARVAQGENVYLHI